MLHRFEMQVIIGRYGIKTYPLFALLFIIYLLILYRRTPDRLRFTYRALFSLYLLEVVALTLFPIDVSGSYAQSLRAASLWSRRVNLVPVHSLAGVAETHLLNIFLTIPYGFGVNLLRDESLKRPVLTAAAIGVCIEGLQALIGLLLGYPYRFIDINDLIFNFFGALIGLLLFWLASTAIRPILTKTERFSADSSYTHDDSQ